MFVPGFSRSWRSHGAIPWTQPPTAVDLVRAISALPRVPRQRKSQNRLSPPLPRRTRAFFLDIMVRRDYTLGTVREQALPGNPNPNLHVPLDRLMSGHVQGTMANNTGDGVIGVVGEPMSLPNLESSLTVSIVRRYQQILARQNSLREVHRHLHRQVFPELLDAVRYRSMLRFFIASSVTNGEWVSTQVVSFEVGYNLNVPVAVRVVDAVHSHMVANCEEHLWQLQSVPRNGWRSFTPPPLRRQDGHSVHRGRTVFRGTPIGGTPRRRSRPRDSSISSSHGSITESDDVRGKKGNHFISNQVIHASTTPHKKKKKVKPFPVVPGPGPCLPVTPVKGPYRHPIVKSKYFELLLDDKFGTRSLDADFPRSHMKESQYYWREFSCWMNISQLIAVRRGRGQLASKRMKREIAEMSEARDKLKSAQEALEKDEGPVPDPVVPLYEKTGLPRFQEWKLYSRDFNYLPRIFPGLSKYEWHSVMPFTLEWKAGYRSYYVEPNIRKDVVDALVASFNGSTAEPEKAKQIMGNERYFFTKEESIYRRFQVCERDAASRIYPRIATQYLTLQAKEDESFIPLPSGVKTGLLNCLALLLFTLAYSSYLMYAGVRSLSSWGMGYSKAKIGDLRKPCELAFSTAHRSVESLWVLATLVELILALTSGMTVRYMLFGLVHLVTLLIDFSTTRLILVGAIICSPYAFSILPFAFIGLGSPLLLATRSSWTIGVMYVSLNLIYHIPKSPSESQPCAILWSLAGICKTVIVGSSKAGFRLVKSLRSLPNRRRRGSQTRESQLISEPVPASGLAIQSTV